MSDIKLPHIDCTDHPDWPAVKWTDMELQVIEKHARAAVELDRASRPAGEVFLHSCHFPECQQDTPPAVSDDVRRLVRKALAVTSLHWPVMQSEHFDAMYDLRDELAKFAGGGLMDWQTFCASMKQQSQERRANNRNCGAEILRARGIQYDVRNDGAHLIVTHNGITADFWPGTGKYRIRPSGNYKRGVFKLVRDLGKKQ